MSENNTPRKISISDLANLATGAFMPIDNGFEYHITPAPDKEPVEIWKEGFVNKDEVKRRFQFEVLLHDLKVFDKSYADILKKENEKKHKRIMGLELGSTYILELGPKGAIKFAETIEEHGYVKYRMYRTGSSFKSEMHFEVIEG